MLRRARDLLITAEGGEEYLGVVLRTLGGVEVELGDIDAAIASQQAAGTRADAPGRRRRRPRVHRVA